MEEREKTSMKQEKRRISKERLGVGQLGSLLAMPVVGLCMADSMVPTISSSAWWNLAWQTPATALS